MCSTIRKIRKTHTQKKEFITLEKIHQKEQPHKLSPNTYWFDQDDMVEDWIHQQYEAGHQTFAFDTESDQFYAYEPKLCLLQIATEHESVLIDPLALSKKGMQSVAKLLEDPQKEKIIHAANNDLIALERDFQIKVNNLFDTGIASHFLSLPSRSLANLLFEFFQIKMSKKYQRFDWGMRPLPEAALCYASGDVEDLISLANILKEQLVEKGRIEAVYQESEALTQKEYQAKTFPLDGYRKLKGASKLNHQQKKTLRSLYLWRHEQCKQENRAAFLILPNAAMLFMSAHKPQSLRGLSQAPGFPQKLVRRYGVAILNALENPPAETKQVHTQSSKKRDPLPPHYEKNLDSLKSWRHIKAKEEGIDPALIASNQLLQQVAKQIPSNQEQLAQITGFLPWRVERYGQELLQQIYQKK